MRFSIKSRKLNRVFDFYMPDRGGYVRLENGSDHGTLGRQICAGGTFLGTTIDSSPDTFETDCRAWYRAHIARQS